ncbi:MAG: acyl-CoA thioesterase [Acidimicrobiales bacterium]
MLALFDVEPSGRHRFHGSSDGGSRRIIDGSQLLAQAIVAASKSLPGHSVRTAQAIFIRTVDDQRPVAFDVEILHEGRSFAGAIVRVMQGDRRCASVTLLLDVERVSPIGHAALAPEVGSPQDAMAYDMPMAGRQLRLVGIVDPNDPDDFGPPVIDAWLHYEPVPTRDDLAKALIAHFTGHLSISTTMRAHKGIGTSMAHHTVSTGVMAIAVSFHHPTRWDGWILYHHESTYVGAGMSHVRGQVFTEQGSLIASFTQEGMVQAMRHDDGIGERPVAERL